MQMGQPRMLDIEWVRSVDGLRVAVERHSIFYGFWLFFGQSVMFFLF